MNFYRSVAAVQKPGSALSCSADLCPVADWCESRVQWARRPRSDGGCAHVLVAVANAASHSSRATTAAAAATTVSTDSTAITCTTATWSGKFPGYASKKMIGIKKRLMGIKKENNMDPIRRGRRGRKEGSKGGRQSRQGMKKGRKDGEKE